MSQRTSGEKPPERLKVKASDGSETLLPKLIRGKYVVLPIFLDIDKERYRDMLLDAAETVLSTFGFSREAYGIPVRSTSWLRELGEEIRNEREFEVDVEEKDVY